MAGAELSIIADDLTGAVDAVVPFSRSGQVARVILDQNPGTTSAEYVAYDTASRESAPQTAQRAVRKIARHATVVGSAMQMKKIDSLLRGNIAVELSAMAAAHRGPFVCAPALPGQGRVTLSGHQTAPHEGQPHAGSAPGVRLSVAEMMWPLRAVLVPLSVVRAGAASLAHALLDWTAAGGLGFLVDAETEHDLRTIVRAGLELPQAPLWVGSSGLAGALADEVCGSRPRRRDLWSWSPPTRWLAVVGSTSRVARAQMAELVALADTVFTVGKEHTGGSGDSAHRLSEQITSAAARGSVVVTTDISLGPLNSLQPARTLAEVTAVAATESPALLLTGGETARHVLQACGVTAMDVIGEVQPGTCLAVRDAPHQQLVVTKAGSFGNPSTLVNAISQVLQRGKML